MDEGDAEPQKPTTSMSLDLGESGMEIGDGPIDVAVVGASQYPGISEDPARLPENFRTDSMPKIDLALATPVPEEIEVAVSEEPIEIEIGEAAAPIEIELSEATGPIAIELAPVEQAAADPNAINPLVLLGMDGATTEPNPTQLSPVMANWFVDLPFTQSLFDPALIGTLRPDAPDWLEVGQKIVAINGREVNSIDQIEGIITASAGQITAEGVSVEISYAEKDSENIKSRSLELNAARSVALLNGFGFKSIQVDGEWRTLVAQSPETGEEALRPGDRLVAYIPTNERLDRENTLADIFTRELENGTSEFAFAVNRDGELWIASLGYSGSAGN